MNWSWFFDGIGTEIIAIIIGLLLGGIEVYKVVIKSKSKQIQKAGNNSKQTQIYEVGSSSESQKTKANLNQKQVAGDDSEQVQTGSIKHE